MELVAAKQPPSKIKLQHALLKLNSDISQMDPKKITNAVLEKLTGALTSPAVVDSASKMLLQHIVGCTVALYDKADSAKFNAFSDSLQ